MKVKSVAHHRNGVAGEDFYVVLFKEPTSGHVADFIGVVFADRRRVAVVNIAAPLEGFRGDYYEDELRLAVLNFERNRASGKLSEEEICDLMYGEHKCVHGSDQISGTSPELCVICKRSIVGG